MASRRPLESKLEVRYLLPQPNLKSAAVVLAAGKGSRLKSEIPKVAHMVAGRPMLYWVLDAVVGLDVERIVVVVGHEGEEVRQLVKEFGSDRILCVEQAEQKGTGHAMRCALGLTEETAGLTETVGAEYDRVFLVYGDGPTLQSETLLNLANGAVNSDETLKDACVLTSILENSTGYGRIIRNDDGNVSAIVEEKDASDEQRQIKEINTGIYVFNREKLAGALGQIDTNNAQGEEYITDVVEILSPNVGAVIAPDPEDVAGVNDQIQLAEAAQILRRRIIQHHQRNGVAIIDPSNTFIESGVRISAGAVIEPGCYLRGECNIGKANIGPNADLLDTIVADEATISYSVIKGATISEGADVGPFAHIRPGTIVGKNAKVGGFVETKKAVIGEGSKVPHLSYVGDALIGKGANLGAGTITCNYDGYNKFQTVIGDGAFIGSDSMLIAPVNIGEGAYIGASSAVVEDVPENALYLERSRPHIVDGWADKHRKRNQDTEK